MQSLFLRKGLIIIEVQNDAALAILLGQKLAKERKKDHLSQQQLAQGICSQSMISSIEKGIYVPNAILLSKLCKRLGISMDNAILKDYLVIDQFDAFNQKIKALCDHHQYEAMLDYLSASNIIDLIYRDEDYQTYYYYYGVATYQFTHDRHSSLRYLRIALNYTFSKQRQYVTPNELLILTTISFLKCRSNETTSGFEDFETCLNRVRADGISGYSENTNILFYQYGLSLYENQEFDKAAKLIAEGIKWTTDNTSHYMLSDLFFLLSKVYEALKRPDYQQTLDKSQLLDEIFDSHFYRI